LNARFIDSLWREGLVPVALASAWLGNELYNINADHMAQPARNISAPIS